MNGVKKIIFDLGVMQSRLESEGANGMTKVTADAHKMLVKMDAEISSLRKWVEEEGVRTNTCTYSILGEICSDCRCEKSSVRQKCLNNIRDHIEIEIANKRLDVFLANVRDHRCSPEASDTNTERK
jgi:hypothetical protein